MDGDLRVYFTRSYTYRKPGALVAGSLALAFGGFALGRLVIALVTEPWSLAVIPTTLFIGGIGGTLAACGVWVLRQWLSRTTLGLVISDDGVRYGTKSHGWDDIHWISGHTESGGIQLFYQTRGRGLARFDRPLMVQPGLTLQEYQDLMETLEDELADKYPGLSIG